MSLLPEEVLVGVDTDLHAPHGGVIQGAKCAILSVPIEGVRVQGRCCCCGVVSEVWQLRVVTAMCSVNEPFDLFFHRGEIVVEALVAGLWGEGRCQVDPAERGAGLGYGSLRFAAGATRRSECAGNENPGGNSHVSILVGGVGALRDRQSLRGSLVVRHTVDSSAATSTEAPGAAVEVAEPRFRFPTWRVPVADRLTRSFPSELELRGDGAPCSEWLNHATARLRSAS